MFFFKTNNRTITIPISKPNTLAAKSKISHVRAEIIGCKNSIPKLIPLNTKRLTTINRMPTTE